MDIQAAIRAVTERRNLGGAEMESVMRAIMTGEATPAQIGGFLVGLRMKGESVEEIAAAARVMRELATRVEAGDGHLVDTCGTGGDSSGSFNVSTASALVVAAAGGKVAKHGNRSVSSQCGSADVLEAAGVRLELSPAQVARCIEELGVGFLFAPLHHSAMKHAVGPRREMGVRTVFNLLGPLTNPAGALHQVIGVFSDHWLEPVAEVLQRLGSRHVLVVHAEDGMDEVSIGAATRVAELKDAQIHTYTVTPERFGLERAEGAGVRVTNARESLARIREALSAVPGPARDIVALNAGAAIYACDLVPSFEAGVERALEIMASGAALERLDALARLTQALGAERDAAG